MCATCIYRYSITYEKDCIALCKDADIRAAQKLVENMAKLLQAG